MLVFVDQEKWIKIQRAEQAPDGLHRAFLGRVSKKELRLDEELQSQLTAEDLPEVNEVLSLYRGVATAQRQTDALRFPRIVREVVAYVASGRASPSERAILVGAFEEGRRQIRRLEKASAGQ